MSRRNKQMKKQQEQKERADPIAFWLNGGDARDILCPKGYTPLSQNEEIVKCAHKIADMVSSMTIMLMENGTNGDIRIKNGLSRKIDIAPNRYMTRKNFVYKIAYDLAVFGNSVAYPIYKDGLLETIELWDIEKVHFEEQDNGYYIRYQNQIFSPDEILHFVLHTDYRRPFVGCGFVNGVKDTVMNLVQANATKTGFLQTKWKPSMIISIDADNEDLQDAKKRRAILDSYIETTEAGEPWLIPAGELRMNTVTPLTLNDLAIQESITLDKQAIAAAFHMPPFMLGVGSFSKEEYNNFVATTIMSVALVIQQELTKKLLYHPGWYFKFNPKSLMQYDLQEKSDFVKTMVSSGMMTRNEGRNEFDYAPANEPGMNQFIVLENYIPVENVGDQKKLKDSA